MAVACLGGISITGVRFSKLSFPLSNMKGHPFGDWRVDAHHGTEMHECWPTARLVFLNGLLFGPRAFFLFNPTANCHFAARDNCATLQ